MTPSGPSARQLTELMFGSCSRSVFTARDSLRSPRLVATTLSNVPFLKSASFVCVQLLVPTARTGAARARTKAEMNWVLMVVSTNFNSGGLRYSVDAESRKPEGGVDAAAC